MLVGNAVLLFSWGLMLMRSFVKETILTNLTFVYSCNLQVEKLMHFFRVPV